MPKNATSRYAMGSSSYVAPWPFRTCIRAGETPADCSDDANVWASQRETAPSPAPFLVHYAIDRPTSTGDWRERPALALLAGKACFAVQGF